MAKKSPYQRVQEEHGSKEKLVEKVLGILERPEDEEKEDFDHRISTMSNRKLLRLLEANETVSGKWGSKDALVDAITKARFPGGNVDYAAKLSTFSLPKLIEFARQHKV